MGAGLKYVTVGLVRTGASAATIAATKTATATKAKQLRVDAIAGLAPARQRSQDRAQGSGAVIDAESKVATLRARIKSSFLF
jgi:hypothetical protein